MSGSTASSAAANNSSLPLSCLIWHPLYRRKGTLPTAIGHVTGQLRILKITRIQERPILCCPILNSKDTEDVKMSHTHTQKNLGSRSFSLPSFFGLWTNISRSFALLYKFGFRAVLKINLWLFKNI